MINAKDITNRKFEKSAFGYKPEEVESYIRELAVEFSQLQKTKEDADKKIDVLADKVREYLRDEEALKDALLGAQRQGKQVIEDAKNTAAHIISEANQRADEIIGQTKIQLEREQANLSNIQKEVSDFKSQLFAMYRQHIDMITSMPGVEEPVEENEQQSYDESQNDVDSDANYADPQYGQERYK